jgi:GGDEF domain-containing protein
MEQSTATSRKILLQDVGIFMFMLSTAGGALIVALAGRQLLYQNILMLMGLAFVSLLVVMRAQAAGVVSSALIILIFTAYKLYNRIAYNTEIELTAYFWPPLVLLVLGGMLIFISMFSTIEGINGILNRRIDEQTVIDPMTGLENQRSMLRSLARYMALCERNGTDMGLMLLRLRYSEELRKVLSPRQFNELRFHLARTVEDVLRLEDRVFSLDEKGSMGIIYFAVEKGAEIVKARLLDKIHQTDLMPELTQHTLTVELSVVFRHYDSSLGRDAMRFYTETEKEFAYEV